MVTKTYSEEQQIYWKIEPHFLYDYVNFANRFRTLQAHDNGLSQYQMKHDGKRMYLVLLTELYQKSLEDLGAVLIALKRRFNQDCTCRYQKRFNSPETPITYTLFHYEPKEANISATVDAYPSETIMVSALNVCVLEKLNPVLVLPHLNTKVCYAKLFQMLKDWSGDQNKRLKAYNKIKHAGIVVGSAKIFNPANDNVPAVVYTDHNAGFTDHPLVVHCLEYTEMEFQLLQDGIVKIARHIKDLIAIYLIAYYPDFLKEKGFTSPLLFLIDRKPNEKDTDAGYSMFV
ncbi:hypothetical protein A3F52_05010 [Candidatus Uhrbacteria bacterium RIFCSPHIGHO2_12_FULL_47_11]|nr:MAG: hypothetical protein A2753_04910 [Candidatus Uhrbacteria bacterium RIFCSPHIGHO2_01_FULL_47_11]OGL76501.1 MAG: hypothetical protein A3F52_05010 [Candidatus Uhrbacteria bacterium RIFCSPHIGHO2_12_FULL_47_11]